MMFSRSRSTATFAQVCALKAALLLLVSACDDPEHNTEDAAVEADAGTRVDGGTQEDASIPPADATGPTGACNEAGTASELDAACEGDAGGELDATNEADADEPDAGSATDATSEADANETDASATDAASAADADQMDAESETDAAELVDASSELDGAGPDGDSAIHDASGDASQDAQPGDAAPPDADTDSGLQCNALGACSCPEHTYDLANGDPRRCVPYQRLAVGREHACAIEEDALTGADKLYCWGKHGYGSFGAGKRFSDLSIVQIGNQGGWQAVSARDHTCAIQNGWLSCWGQNSYGQLGDGSYNPSFQPAAVKPDQPTSGSNGGWQSVGAGEWHTCGIRNGSLYCWGDFDAPLVDLNPRRVSLEPMHVGVEPGWYGLSVGKYHTCAFLREHLYCWGQNSEGQVGDRSNFAGTWDAVAAGGEHTCAIQAGRMYCWGSNAQGQLGDGTTTPRSGRVQVGTDADWTSVTAGDSHTCGMRGGRVFCWGVNTEYQLGRASPPGVSLSTPQAPGQVGTATDWQHVVLGVHYGCGVRDGETFCWGFGTPTSAPLTRIGTAADWTAIADNFTGFSCGLRGDKLYCWGTNDYGQLGTGSKTASTEPVLVQPAAGWTDVAVGVHHACGIRDGGLYCWGRNNDGQLGDGSALDQTLPARVGTGTGWLSVAAAATRSCAIQAGALYCWGRNDAGGLGDGMSYQSSTPVGIGGNDWESVTAGVWHTCAIRAGRGYCWGYDVSGQLGRHPRATSSLFPLALDQSLFALLTGAQSWQQLAASGHRSCGVRQGTVYCWGDARLACDAGSPQDFCTIPPEIESEPYRVDQSTAWTRLAGGGHASTDSSDVIYDNMCGIRAGELLCWSQSTLGAASHPVLLQKSTAKDWEHVSVGAYKDLCGIRAGQLYCSGLDLTGLGLEPWSPVRVALPD